jgi:hypothetical protein
MQAHGKIESSKSGKVSLATAIVIVMGAVLISVVPSFNGQDLAEIPGPPPAVAPTRRMTALWPTEMTPGAYDGVVGRVSYTFRVADRGWWSGTDDGSLFVRDDPAYGWMRFWDPDQVYGDPCMHMLRPYLGPTARQLADAMAAMPAMRSAAITDARVGGYRAYRIDLVPMPDVCRPFDTYLWQASDAGDDSTIRRPRLSDSHIAVWVLDVNGDRFVIDTEVGSEAGPKATDAIREIVGSVRFLPSPQIVDSNQFE